MTEILTKEDVAKLGAMQGTGIVGLTGGGGTPAPTGLLWLHESLDDKGQIEAHVVTYKDRKLRIVRVFSRVFPGSRVNFETRTHWQGQIDGVTVEGLLTDHSNEVAEALVAIVDKA